MNLSKAMLSPTLSQEWQAHWRGHRITVRNSLSEQLLIDGVLAHRHGPSLCTEMRLYGQIVHEGQAHQVMAHIGSVSGLKVGCHIFVDGQLIGGDVDRKILALSANRPIEEQIKNVQSCLKASLFTLPILLALAVVFHDGAWAFLAVWTLSLSLRAARELRRLTAQASKIQ